MHNATIWRRVTRSRPARHRGRVLAPIFSALALSVALSGCLGSTYAYVSHRNSDGTELYFKIPARWTMFNAKQVITAQNGPLNNTQIRQIETGQWENTFSAAPHPAVKTVLNELAEYPNGFVIARQLGESDRDALSLAGMRSQILNADPLSADATGYNVLNYSEYTASGGIRGSRLTTDITIGNGLVSTFSQVVEVDPQTNYIYMIAVACKASCWGPNQGVIQQVLNSWTVKEQK